MKHFNLLNNTRWFATVILLLTFCIGQTWGTSYTITFATGSSDGTSISSGSTNASTIVASGSSSYVTGKVTTSGYTYYAGSSGLKVGKSGNGGTVTFSLATSYQLTNPTIIVKAKRYNSSKEVKLNANSVGQITTPTDANWHWYSYNYSKKITSLTLNASQYCWVESVTITDECNAIDVTGGSAVILPLGSTTYNAYDWSKAGAPWAQATVASYPISSSYYCVSFTQVKDAGSTNGLEFLASSGVVSISGITSTYGIDVDVNISSGSGFSIALTGATTLTGQSSGTKTISTTSTSATLTISKTAAGTGYVKYIKVTPKTAACGTDPTVGAASLNGSFSLSSVGVRCPTSGTAVQSNCSWEDYGFVWGTSNSGTRPDLTSDASNKVQTGTSGTGNTWDDALEGSFSTGVTYYYRAYGQNGHGLAYGTVASFTPFKVYYNANGGTGTIADQIVNTGGSVTLSDGTGFSKTGYHITKWALGSAGGTQSNPSSSSGSVTANKEYYAIWTANTYAITLNQNGATTNSSPTSVNATYDAHALSSAITNPTKTDYIFGGWNTKADGSGLTVIGTNGELIADVSGYTDASGNWTKAGTETLYAKWTEHTYTNYRTSCCTDPGLAYGTGSVNKTFGDGTFTNTLTNSNSVSVSYESSDTDVATVASDGTVTIKGAGSATITASSAAQTVSTVAYCADEASYTLTVAKADISPSLSYSSDNVTVDETSGTPTVSGNSGSGAVTYAITSISPAGCATINTSTGVVTGVAVGSITVTATIAATDNYNGSTATADLSIISASYFPKGKTIFIQAESTSAWTGGGCVKAWFHTAGGSETAQSTYWLFDATGGDAGKKLFATVVPASGDLPYLDIQRFASNCSDWWNKNGGCSYADASGSNAIRSTGKHDDSSDGDYVRWNATGVTLDLYGDPSDDDWASSLASFSDQGAGVWTATYSNYAPANAAGESQNFKAKTNYNGWIGNYVDSDHSNSDATLDGMHVGSTYNITATLDITDHSLTMSKTFVKGEVSFDLQGHGSAISKLTNVTAGSKISAPSPAPTATGYTFGGWFTDPECMDEWNFATDEVDETMTLYAKWTANVYTITKTLTNVANAGLPASFTYTGATTTALNSTFTVDATNFFLPSSIAVTMGGTPLTSGTDYTYNNSTGAFTFDRIISGDIVITASATAKLKSIAITTQPTTRKYFAGESFSSTGAVVTATMGDGSTKAVTASATWTPPATPLAAGTGLTVTASYTENAINQTATTTIDVYSVTVNKKNEDGDAVSADGVTAMWTLGTKALAASATSASKYVFKQWEVTGASIGSTSSANTTLSNPTANVVVNAVFWKPRTVKWSVNGNDSYASSETVAYNGTISTVPSDPSGLACAGTFIAWTDAAHNNGQTAKDDDSYYESKLFTDAGDFPNITAETTTFYAVFAEKTNSDGYKYIGDDGTLADGKKYIFVNAKSAGSAYALKATDLAAPNSGNNGTAVSVTVTSNAEGVLVTTINTALEFEYVSSGTKLKYEVDGPATRYLFINGDGVGMKSDDSRSRYTTDAGLQGWNNKVTTYYDVYYNSTNEKFERKESAGSRVYAFIKQTAIYGNYVTECDANIVSVTYDANGGSTSCTNTTTDKTEDFTVCSSAPTRDYYTFAGWLCSADSKTYAASATIDDAVIDADFTLTAQWTPVPYSITYELYGGTNSGSNPATYNVTTATITLQDPIKGHDRFDGWYKTYSAGVYSNPVTSIPLGSHGDITLYAKWAARHEIIFDADGATTTIYRADDEALNASVAGQGSIPANPSAPSACSSKVFVGWVAEEIDGETDDEPTFLDVTSKVNADKHYYAVWATSVGNSIAAVEDVSFTGGEYTTYFSKTYGLKSNDKYVYKNSIWTSSDMTAGTKVKIKVKHLSNSSAATLTIALINSSGTVVTSTTLSTTANSNNIDNAAYSSNVELIATTAVTGYQITLSNIGSSSGVVILAATREVVATRSAYSTSCCATKVTLSDPSITGTGATITFDKVSPVATCDGSKTVTATVTVTAGYQVTELSFSGGSVNVSPAISTPLTSSQNYTLTFAEGTNATLTTTATVSAKPLNSITITPSSGEVYVGQYVDFTVSYDPADYINPGYTLNATPVYVTKESAAPANTKLRLKGGRGSGPGASITETVNETVTIKASGDNTKTASVNMTVNPLPRVHFADLVHGKAFADVAATIEANALSATKTTPTSDDWTTPNANTCEENHLHLVGWIREDWPALVAYLNGTGDAPTTVAITGAGNDGSGHAYYIAAGASIDVQTFNGVTFYAVWAQIE